MTAENFNSYGSRRGNDRVMTRGTFANVRIKNLMLAGEEGGSTILGERGRLACGGGRLGRNLRQKIHAPVVLQAVEIHAHSLAVGENEWQLAQPAGYPSRRGSRFRRHCGSSRDHGIASAASGLMTPFSSSEGISGTSR